MKRNGMEGIGVELETAGWNGGRERLGLGRGFKALRDVGLGFRPGRPVACFSTKLDEEALPDEQMEMPPAFGKEGSAGGFFFFIFF